LASAAIVKTGPTISLPKRIALALLCDPLLSLVMPAQFVLTAHVAVVVGHAGRRIVEAHAVDDHGAEAGDRPGRKGALGVGRRAGAAATAAGQHDRGAQHFQESLGRSAVQVGETGEHVGSPCGGWGAMARVPAMSGL
jgi:hypothetical protein